jgi:hypothetical protein
VFLKKRQEEEAVFFQEVGERRFNKRKREKYSAYQK